jgi:hypothetical protein
MAHESHPDQSRWQFQHSDRIVYDKANGEVVHVHQVLWRPDREAPAQSVIDADARRVAAKIAKRAEETLDVLPVKLEQLERNIAYAVDLRTKELVKKAK